MAKRHKPRLEPPRSSSCQAILFDGAAKRLGGSLQMAAKRHGVDLDLQGLKNYDAVYHKAKHVIVWGGRKPLDFFLSKPQNYLAVENGLICQAEGMWVDNRGWFADSALCTERHFDTPATDAEIARLETIFKTQFDWEPFGHDADPNRPILFAIQKNIDAPCLLHYPDADPELPAMASALASVAKYAPHQKILVRPHPLCPIDWKKHLSCYLPRFGPNWEVDTSPNVYQTLKRCSGLITVNSTLASEAVGFGIPVAVLGNSAYTRAGVMLECSGNPSKLRSLFDHQPSESAVIRYQCACLRHQIRYSADATEIGSNPYFAKWVSAAAGRTRMDVCLVKYFSDPEDEEVWNRNVAILSAHPLLDLHIWDNTDVNLGLTAARNYLLKDCPNPVICLMDFDLDLERVSWERLIGKAMEPDTGIVSPVTEGWSTIQNGAEWEPKEVLACNCMVMRRDVLGEVGGLDNEYFVAYADWDLIRRMQNADRRIWQHNLSTVKHFGFSQANTNKENIWAKDRAIFLRKWGRLLDKSKR